METFRLAEVGFLVQAAMHVGFVAVNLAMFGQPGYAFASGVLAVAAVLSAVALRHGWEDHAPLLAWSTLATAVVAAVRWATAELGQPLDATSPLALLLPIGHAVVATAGWALWRGVLDPGNARALRRLAVGAGLLAAACLGFAGFALAAGGVPIGACLLAGAAGSGLVAWGAWQAARTASPRGPDRPTPTATREGTARPAESRRPRSRSAP